MRIAFILQEFPSRSETFIFNQIAGITKLGHAIDIYAFKCGDAQVIRDDFIKDNFFGKIHYYKNPEGRIEFYLNGLKVIFGQFPIYPAEILRSFHYLRNKKHLIGIFRLLNIIPTFLPVKKYDIIHCHFGDMGLIATRLKEIGVICGKIVITFHGADMTALIRKRGESLYQNLFKNGNLFLPVSENWKNLLLSWGCPKDKTYVHHMGVDLKFFQSEAAKKSVKTKLNIITVCRLVAKKGISDGLKAVAHVSLKNRVGLQYVIVGDGPLRQQLENLADDLGLSNGIVKFVGFQPQNEVKELLRRSHIFLAPSKTSKEGDQEGIPVSIMEAMAMRLTVISTRHSGVPELIQDGKSGYLVKEGDWEAIAEKILFLFDDQEKMNSIGTHGQNTIKREFNANILNLKLIELYQTALQQNETL